MLGSPTPRGNGDPEKDMRVCREANCSRPMQFLRSAKRLSRLGNYCYESFVPERFIAHLLIKYWNTCSESVIRPLRKSTTALAPAVTVLLSNGQPARIPLRGFVQPRVRLSLALTAASS
uniref:Uncharacterized protein n=1 Tax=Steinernema glaseri TaxID=37863 RepID=A0A1I7YNF4_9BILA